MLCPICRQDFTHSSSLKKHIIKNHEDADLEDHNIETDLIIGQKIKRRKQEGPETDL